MTETPQELLSRLTGFRNDVAVQKCPCGDKSCSQYTLSTQRSSGFDHWDAALYAAAPRLYRELDAALAREEALRAALVDAVELTHGVSFSDNPVMAAWGYLVEVKIRAALAVKP